MPDTKTAAALRPPRAEALLDVAAALLVEKGYSGLSFRSVASRAGVGIGNLQHYFPTRAALIHALLERTFEASVATLAGRPASDPDTDILAAISHVLEEQGRREPCVLFWELWALSAHDPEASAVMTGFYDRYVAHIAGLIRAARPEVEAEAAHRAGLLIAALLEGASLFRGHGRPADRLPAGFDTALVSLVRDIVSRA